MPSVRLPGVHLGLDVRQWRGVLQRQLRNGLLLPRGSVCGWTGVHRLQVRSLHAEYGLRDREGLL